MIRVMKSVILMIMVGMLLAFSTNEKNAENCPGTVSIEDIAETIERPEATESPVVNIREITKEDIRAKMLFKKEEELYKITGIENNKERFLEYKKIIFKYAQWDGIPETVFDCYTPEEVTLICRMVETECYQQDFDSKCNVASVAFNRMESGRFGSTMTEIITKENPKQFAYGRKKLTEDSILAVQYAFEFGDTTQGALFFHSGKWTPKFNKADYIFTDDCGHHFYK